MRRLRSIPPAALATPLLAPGAPAAAAIPKTCGKLGGTAVAATAEMRIVKRAVGP